MGYPVSFQGGGIRPSVPLRPTPQDVQDAAGGQLRFVITSSLGSMSFARGFGTRASQTLFRANNPAATHVVTEDTRTAVRTFLPFLQLLELRVQQVDDGLVVNLRHQHQQSLVPGETTVEVR